MSRLLVSNADNEFVGRLITALAEDHDVAISALAVDPADVVVEGPNIEPVTEPADETHVLLTMPTDDEAANRAMSLIDAVDAHLLFIANELDPQHQRVIAHMKASGSPWTILHPVSMMDFSFAALPAQISMGGVVFGISGRTPIGFVSAADVMRVLTVIVEGEGHAGQEYVLSGPAAVDMPTVVEEVSSVLGRQIDYIDLPEQDLKNLMVQYGRQDPDMIERLVMSHMRAWRDGQADIVTGTVLELTGEEPESVSQWLERHADDYPSSQSLVQKAASKMVRARYGSRILK